MKNKTFLFTATLLLLLLGAAGGEKKDHSKSEIIATRTLIYNPTAAFLCTPRTHMLKRKNDDLELIFLSNGEAIRTYDNAVVTIYGTKVKQLSNTCPDVIEVKKISKN